MEPMPSLDLTTPFIKIVATCSWAVSRLPKIRQLLSRPKIYQLYRCPPEFDETAVGGSFVDMARDDGSTLLALRAFHLAANICSGYHLFHREMDCWIEPYTPLRFAGQFGYDQLYVWNINPELNVRGILLEGSRAWF